MLALLLMALLQLSDCEWCGAPEAPAQLTNVARLAPANEPGERMVVTGTIYRRDGRTPASNVLLYVYHTNAAGIYPKRGNERGNDRRHGYLRGWLRTGADGRYRIESIRPGSYPSRRDPAHIHPTIKMAPRRVLDRRVPLRRRPEAHRRPAQGPGRDYAHDETGRGMGGGEEHRVAALTGVGYRRWAFGFLERRPLHASPQTPNA